MSRATRVLGLLSLLLVLTSSLSLAQVDWRNGGASSPTPMQPLQLRNAIDALAAREEARHVVIHFDGPVSLDRRAELDASGVSLLSYLGGHAYFAALRRGIDSGRASAVEGTVAVEAIDTERKIHPDLAAGIAHPWSIVAGGGEGPKATDPIVAIYLLFHRDVEMLREGEGVVRAHGGSVQSWLHSVNGAVVHLSLGAVRALAADDRVMYVEPPLPQFVELNDSNRSRIGADIINDPPYGLSGAGIDVLVYDGGKSALHGDMAGRITIGQSDTSGTSDHATHVACTVAGDGAGSGGTFRGMAPGADIISYGFEQEGGLSQGFLYTDPGDLEADYTEAISLYGADLSNNSIGTNTAPNGFPCEWEGNYGVTGALIDEVARGSLGAPFRIVWANGNERQGSAPCGSTYVTTAPPACAKNHITVGALNSDDDTVTSFTSWGPCDDGRIKPDISGPGCQSGGDGSVTSCSSSGGYTTKCGTSMSSPSVAGVAALLLEQYRAQFPGEPDFRNSTLKAILAQTAEDVVTPGPDYQTGYGSVRAAPAADVIIEERFLEAEVAQGETYTFLVLVGPTDTELRVTLAWDDPAGTPDVNPVLVNDLDLRVLSPGGGTVHFPWTLDPANPADPAVRTQRDGVNNIEQVVIDAPAQGAYTVEVTGFNIAEGPTQTFGVAASPSLINCSSAGVLSASPAKISCDAQLELQVIDCDLNTNDLVTESVNVSATSDSEPGGETVLLTETDPASASFTGSLPVDTVDAAGTLFVSEGDTITVTYTDADDGEGSQNVPVTRDVTVDCTPPTITSVTVPQINPRDATIDVGADEPVRLTVSYGTSCGALTDQAAAFSLSASHLIELSGLTDDTTYFFSVLAEDEAGNQTTADNGGSCYSFTTLPVPDFYTEQFESGLDLEGKVMTFSPGHPEDFYSACIEDLVGGLPTDPTGGENLGLGDDPSTSRSLTGGETVSLYGQAYGTVHIGPNGYLTFGTGDSDYDETLGEHFGLPRVAALYDDLNPSVGGSVTWLQLADRIAVTWQDVPEYNTSNANTFQIEIFFDGTIRLSWVDVDSGDAIVGLSSGGGLDPDFFETDLSAAGVCGPKPPLVQDVEVDTNVSDAVTATLVGIDDGLPGPMTYRIYSLPEFGQLSDPVGAVSIVSVPFDLAGDQVLITPYSGYAGADEFTYRADDGGTPPEGGESNLGRVDVDITVGGHEVLHQFLTDDSDPGWSTTGGWAFGQPTGGGSHSGDPTSGATGSNVYGYNLAGDYGNGMGQEYLTTGSFDLSNVEDTTIDFQRWLGIESAFKDKAAVQISIDGGSWTQIWSHFGPAIDESAWNPISYDISTLADRQSDVRFRWVMGTTDAFGTYPGWNIDDVRISGVVVSTCSQAPGEVTEVLFEAKDRLTWNAGPGPGGGGSHYDTIRSGDTQDFLGAAVCVEPDGDDGETTDAQEPLTGEVYYYLVRAENGCGPGPLGGERSAVSCDP